VRVVVLVDGEHYPPVVRSAIGSIRARGDDIVGAVFLGGSEKIKAGDLESAFGIRVERGPEARETFKRVLEESRPDSVIDLSDEPVATPRLRFALAAEALIRGIAYCGPDFELRAPRLERVLTKPSVRVIATGKRSGKTAVAGALARRARDRGRRPVIVAMGRGGPEAPDVIEAGARLGPAELLAIADAGSHAASDYIEDAVTTGVTTIGCRRVGGGFAGQPFQSNVAAGARLAESRDEDLVVLEGSGAAVPPVLSHAGIVCVPAGGEEGATAYLGPYRLLLADLALVTMADNNPPATRTESAVRGAHPGIEVVRAVLRPSPLSDVAGRKIFYCCAAPESAGDQIRRHLEGSYGCEVAGMSHALSDRAALEAALGAPVAYDVLVTEIKGAAVDVAVRAAMRAGREVVFADNELMGDGVLEALDAVLDLADARAK
jgi:cyclic 2,3-diphosphoglycerate synthetase